MIPRGRLFWKYVFVLAVLVTVALLASGVVQLYFSYHENKAALIAIQKEKALGAASRIEAFVKEIERQMGWTTQPQLVAPAAALEQRKVDFIRLQRQVQAITELAHIDAAGREQLRVSRLAMDVVGSEIDFSDHPKFVEARKGQTWFGPVYFRKESEPYMTISMPQIGGSGVTVAEVNLKFIWDVISQIKIGKAGRAYVVDGEGNLIAHPDISLVLQKTSLVSLPQVESALSTPGAGAHDATIAHDPQARPVLSAFSSIPTLHWVVFAEQPLEEAFEPLYDSLKRTVSLLALGIVFSVVMGLVLARRMVRPIRVLQEGAARIGAGALGHRIDVKTGDELEALAAQFNQMTGQLQESYATLEQRVVERTQQLTEALEQQTATAEVLRVTSGSPTDVTPVFTAILVSATRLCEAQLGILFRYDGHAFHMVAHHNASAPFVEILSGPLRPSPEIGIDRWLGDPTPFQVSDVRATVPYAESEPYAVVGADLEGIRTLLGVPLAREGRLIGLITIYRREVKPFAEKQIAVIETFADQAVIAIENVRLFTELQDRTRELARTVEQLQALSEVGQAVSSTLDLDTVLTTVVSRASQLAGADGCSIWEYDDVAEIFRVRSARQSADDLAEQQRVVLLHRGEGAVGRLADTRQPVQIPDILAEGAYRGRLREALTRGGYRALLAVPLLQEDRIVGGLVLSRKAPGEFAAETVELMKTFATQSALAIQNARLFQELEEKSRELEIANRHKSEFLANMSHELRTPLNAIIGFSEVLIERMFGDVNEKQDEYLRDIYSSGRHLLSLINDILDLSKVEAGRMELDLGTFDLPQAIANALTLVRSRAEAHTIRLQASIDDRLGDFVADERKVKQILLNLLSNAVKFTPDSGQVTVTAMLVDGAAEIAITDTGIGIAPEDQTAVFEEFRQVGTDYARKREGTGLGLALTRKFVELHGGTIWLKSAPGEGSTFTFTLPVRTWPTSSS